MPEEQKEEYYIVSGEDLLKNEYEPKKIETEDKVKKFDIKPEKLEIDLTQPEPSLLKKEISPREEPIQEAIIEERIQKSLQSSSQEEKSISGFKIEEGTLTIPETTPAVLKGNLEKFTKTLLPQIPWKIIFIGLAIFIVLGSGYYGFRYYQKKQAEKKFLEERSKIKIELPVTIETSTPTTSTETNVIATTQSQFTTSTQPVIQQPPIITASPTLPSPSKATPTITTELEKKTTTSQPAKPIIIEEEKKTEYVSGQVIKFDWLNQYFAEVKSLDNDGLKTALSNLIKHQGKRYTLENIHLIYSKRDIPGNVFQEYFLQPTFADQAQKSRLYQSLGLDYALLMYYSATNKYPIYIFKVKDSSYIKTFVSLWEEKSLISDSQILFLGFNRGKSVGGFRTYSYLGFDYNLIKFSNNNYSLVWSLYNDLLIISTSEFGFKKLVEEIINHGS